MYQNILVAVDGSASSLRALNEAIQMAKLARGKVTALYVLDHSSTFTYAGEYEPRAMVDALHEDARRVLGEVQKRITELQVPGDVEVIETDGIGEDVASCLQRCAQSRGADLFVMGTHGRRGIRRLVLGSVAERFLRFSTCPVLLVRDDVPAQ
ncbi:universal stress protein [Paraburkholderia phenazinium]|uniref:Universal stress protein n=1 Tax=Paraburkholderia phenazinium TaxID=60549 RepID=A0A1G8BEB1_9BURK|nr:universal stress protein [Paraburkholderia phenazinium]SDH31414.1 Nucleotide-binding universal stress protein, UspA family [Paraburkholderia phenazinium]